MSANLDNFEALLDAQEEHAGERLTATVGSVANKDAIVGPFDLDPIAVAGGEADSGGYTLQMRVSDFTDPPSQNATVQVTDRTDTNFFVLHFSESAGVYLITVGDPAANG